MPAHPITIGSQFTVGKSELFHVEARLGSGGFGDVLRAVRLDPKPAITVAVKIPQEDILTDPTWRAKFERESRIMGNLSHAHIAKVYNVVTFPGGEPAIIQEYIPDARSLVDFLRDHPECTASIFIQTLSALQYMHDPASKPSTIHRDLSPSNILVDVAGHARIIDFGLAREDPRLSTTLTRAWSGFGTHGCMSPEQEESARDADERSDIYALGKSFGAAIQRCRPYHVRIDKLPEPWPELIGTMTEYDPDDRYQCAGEVIEAALFEFAQHGTNITPVRPHTEDHLLEPSTFPMRSEWGTLLCKSLTHSPKINPDVLEEHTRRGWARVFGAALPADGAAVLHRVLEDNGMQALYRGQASFEDCDPFGLLCSQLFPLLDVDDRRRCFEMTAKLAVLYHRYSLMDALRGMYSVSNDPSEQATLVAILKQADPFGTIEGRGTIPL